MFLVKFYFERQTTMEKIHFLLADLVELTILYIIICGSRRAFDTRCRRGRPAEKRFVCIVSPPTHAVVIIIIINRKPGGGGVQVS